MGIEYLFMAVVGGVGYVWGAIVGAGLVKLLDDWLQVALPALIGTSGSYEVIVFGVALVLVLKYLPDGLWSVVARKFPKPQRAVNWQNAADLPVRAKPAMGQPVLVVDKIRKQFGGLVAVNDISFDIAAGQIVGLIGPNGAGKSTLTNLLSGDLLPTSGTITLDGHDITGWTPEKISRHRLGRSYQKTNIFRTFTVWDNVRLAAQSRVQPHPFNPLGLS